MADEFLFFGLKSEQSALGIEPGVPKQQKVEESAIPAEIRKISYENSTKLDSETLRMLRRTRHAHDETVVYMQSDIQFYDTFYHSGNELGIDEELLKEARSIRRVYKTYPEYLYAMHIRDLYMDEIRDKVGGEELFLILLRSGGLNCWIPPEPIYSKKAIDYEDGSAGIFDTSDLIDWDDDKMIEYLETIRKERGFDKDIPTRGYIVTDHLTLYHSTLIGDDDDRPRRNMSVNLADVGELRRILQGWYQDDTQTSGKDKEASDLEKRAFSKTPKKLEEQYYLSFVLDMSKEFRNAMDGIPNEEQKDPNEMVYDEYSNKPMSRKEYELRGTLRMLKDMGLDNSLKLMKLLGVGSSREHALLQNKITKNKRKRKTVKTYDEVYGDTISEPSKQELIFSDLDALKSQMFPD